METSTTQQGPTMKTEPQKEHLWLHKLVGEWTYEGEAGAGQPHGEVQGDRERAVAREPLDSGRRTGRDARRVRRDDDDDAGL